VRFEDNTIGGGLQNGPAEDASERIQDREVGLSTEVRTSWSQYDAVRGNATLPGDFLLRAPGDIVADEEGQ